MSMWEDMATLFEENSHSGVFFETKETQKVLKKIHSTINTNFPQMVFLLGEPGSGKSFLLNHLSKSYKDKRKCLLIENPFISPDELLKRMLNFVDVEPKQDVESMRLQAIEAYKDFPHIIMIDEAQLSQTPLREFIRILSDSKVFWFLIAMHTKEGEDLLRNPHFLSRAHQVVYMGKLDILECDAYLKKMLSLSQFSDISSIVNQQMIGKSYNYTHGNFRSFKKLYYNFFKLIDYANIHERLEFTKPSPRVLEMAAIKAGLVLDKKGLSEFDELVNATSKFKNKDDDYLRINKKMLVAFLALILILSGIWALFTKGVLNFSNPEQQSISKSTPATETKKEPVEEKKQVATSVKKEATVEAKKEVKKEKVVKKQTPKPQTVSSKPVLKFYPPDTDVEDLEEEKYEEKRRKKSYVDVPDEEEIEIVDYDSSLDAEPNFLDKKVKKAHRGPLLKLQNAKPKSVKSLAANYTKPDYEKALQIAQIYYNKRDYINASSWAKKANEVNKEKEGAWILYAKSQYKRGKKSEAKKVLNLFLNYKASPTASSLLKSWSKEEK